ncbi:MAG: hypothetical protein QOD41_2931 [Cryptosporangiaceae bacterium]|jgi:uncharacterized protein (TIGR03083 family)|nr:hypothetical protein [Cryptosporangiaceae bacterium]
MTPERLLAEFRANAERLAAVVATAPGAPVPSCPDWLVSDLAEHVAMAYLHKVAAIRERTQPEWPPELGTVDPLVLLRDAYAELSALFEAHDPADPAWTWTDDQTVGFWIRRMAHETAVHRVDAEQAAGERTPVDPGLAADGVDEMLAVILPAVQRHWPDEVRKVLAGAAGEVVAIRTGGREWRLELSTGGVGFGPAGDPDATVEGEPESVLLWVWGRDPGSGVTVTGSGDAVTLARAALAVGSQ